MQYIFFDGWPGLLRTLVIGLLAYAALVVLLRISGKRTLAKLNAFDLVVTVAIGSTLATVLLNKDVALSEGVLAFALLIGMQFVVTWSSVRMSWVKRISKSEPTLLAYRGALAREALRAQRVTEDELHAAVRGAGLSGLEDAAAVVLETDGSFSVIRDLGEQASALRSFAPSL